MRASTDPFNHSSDTDLKDYMNIFSPLNKAKKQLKIKVKNKLRHVKSM